MNGYSKLNTPNFWIGQIEIKFIKFFKDQTFSEIFDFREHSLNKCGIHARNRLNTTFVQGMISKIKAFGNVLYFEFFEYRGYSSKKCEIHPILRMNITFVQGIISKYEEFEIVLFENSSNFAIISQTNVEFICFCEWKPYLFAKWS